MSEWLRWLKYYLLSITDLAWFKGSLAFIGGAIMVHMWLEESAIRAALAIYLIDMSLWIGIVLCKDVLSIYKKWFFVRWYWEKDFSVQKFGWGIIKLMLYWLALVLANQVDIIFDALISHTNDTNIFEVKYYYLWYIAVHEALSAFKKLAKIWLPIPDDIIDRLNKYKKWIK